MKHSQSLLLVIKEALAHIVRTRFWFKLSPSITAGAHISTDFFGINIAPSSDPRFDDFIIERLQELGLKNVRLDFSYDSLNNVAERLLQRVLAEDFIVMLDLLPPKEEALILATNIEAQQRWQDFVKTVSEHYSDKVAYFEIGATPNRSKWSGFNLDSYLAAWKIAHQQLTHIKHKLAGPNVSDFEPVSNIALLADMQRQGCSPAIHTDNLFVERVVEPEAFDHRVFGRLLTTLFKLNLVKKTRIYNELSQHYGCAQTVCTYTGWTSKRLARFSDSPEIKKADYLIRYLVITAASNTLDKVYWGPLICHRDGLIDDGATDYPDIDNVSFYEQIRGDYQQVYIRPAFYALSNVIKQLSNTQCIQAVNVDNGIHHFIFKQNNGSELHVSWLRDRHILALDLLYTQQQLGTAVFINSIGEKLTQPAISLSETPIFIQFDTPQELKLSPSKMNRLTVAPTPLFPSIDNVEFMHYHNTEWQGAVAIKPGMNPADTAISMLPDNLLILPQLSVHRDQRNKVWSSKNPTNPDETIIIKQNRATGIKKFTYRFTASKGERHWNNASEMIRRGISSPAPIAYFEQKKNAGIRHNYYVCEYVPNAFSARDAFTAFSQGQEEYAGFNKQDIFLALAQFTCKMHNRKIIHNDLSGGNLLITSTDENSLHVTAIDIGRATILAPTDKITQKMRLIDLCRLCYKLDWPNRHSFMAVYFKVYGREFDSGWSMPLKRYDWKHITKRKIKKLLKRKRKNSA